MTFKPTVRASEPGREFSWLGKLLLPRILDAEHQFRLEPVGEGRTKFVQSEEFRGFLVRLILNRIGDQTRLGFEAMNQALKERVEAGDSAAR